MKTEYKIQLSVSGVWVDLIAKIVHLPYIGWRVEKITFRGMFSGFDIDYKPSLLETIYAEKQIRAQMDEHKKAQKKSDKLEMELNCNEQV